MTKVKDYGYYVFIREKNKAKICNPSIKNTDLLVFSTFLANIFAALCAFFVHFLTILNKFVAIYKKQINCKFIQVLQKIEVYKIIFS
jgi:hypothetical protein